MWLDRSRSRASKRPKNASGAINPNSKEGTDARNNGVAIPNKAVVIKAEAISQVADSSKVGVNARVADPTHSSPARVLRRDKASRTRGTIVLPEIHPATGDPIRRGVQKIRLGLLPRYYHPSPSSTLPMPPRMLPSSFRL